MHWSSFCPLESLFGICVKEIGKLTQFCAAFETFRFLRLEAGIVEAGAHIGVNMLGKVPLVNFLMPSAHLTNWDVNMLGKVPLVIFLMPCAHLTSWDEAGRRKCEAWQARTATRRLPPLRPRGNESSVLSVSFPGSDHRPMSCQGGVGGFLAGRGLGQEKVAENPKLGCVVVFEMIEPIMVTKRSSYLAKDSVMA